MIDHDDIQNPQNITHYELNQTKIEQHSMTAS